MTGLIDALNVLNTMLYLESIQGATMTSEPGYNTTMCLEKTGIKCKEVKFSFPRNYYVQKDKETLTCTICALVITLRLSSKITVVKDKNYFSHFEKFNCCGPLQTTC